jgi:hypothetical protein
MLPLIDWLPILDRTFRSFEEGGYHGRLEIVWYGGKISRIEKHDSIITPEQLQQFVPSEEPPV